MRKELYHMKAEGRGFPLDRLPWPLVPVPILGRAFLDGLKYLEAAGPEAVVNCYPWRIRRRKDQAIMKTELSNHGQTAASPAGSTSEQAIARGVVGLALAGFGLWGVLLALVGALLLAIGAGMIWIFWGVIRGVFGLL